MEKKNIELKLDGWYLQALSLLFIALKLMGYINWNWIWVLSPLWIQLIILIIYIAVMFVPWNKLFKKGYYGYRK